MTLRSIALTAAATMMVAASAAAQTAPHKTTPKKPAAHPAAAVSGTLTAAQRAALMNPAKLIARAPAVFQASFETSAGDFVIEVHRDWAPNGADRFYNLVKNGFYNGDRFFRVMPNFMAQFGMNGDPAIQKHWSDANIKDDPVTQKNLRGYVSFATAGPNTRSTQIFINFNDRNVGLDSQGFAPFGQVVSGMESVDKIYSGYGNPPDEQQDGIKAGGNKYLAAKFPKLDYVKRATIVKTPPPAK
jgi:peptidyl-prolyl cis-trans isomerase A (cyclophilin A)